MDTMVILWYDVSTIKSKSKDRDTAYLIAKHCEYSSRLT